MLWMCLTDDFLKCSHTWPVVFHLLLTAFPLLKKKCQNIVCARAVKPARGVSLILYLTFFSTLSGKTIFASANLLLMQVALLVWSKSSLPQHSLPWHTVFLLSLFSSFLRWECKIALPLWIPSWIPCLQISCESVSSSVIRNDNQDNVVQTVCKVERSRKSLNVTKLNCFPMLLWFIIRRPWDLQWYSCRVAFLIGTNPTQQSFT